MKGVKQNDWEASTVVQLVTGISAQKTCPSPSTPAHVVHVGAFRWSGNPQVPGFPHLPQNTGDGITDTFLLLCSKSGYTCKNPE